MLFCYNANQLVSSYTSTCKLIHFVLLMTTSQTICLMAEAGTRQRCVRGGVCEELVREGELER